MTSVSYLFVIDQEQILEGTWVRKDSARFLDFLGIRPCFWISWSNWETTPLRDTVAKGVCVWRGGWVNPAYLEDRLRADNALQVLGIKEKIKLIFALHCSNLSILE